MVKIKKILVSYFVLLIAFLFIGCSGVTIKESYEKTPLNAKSIGEGRTSYKMVHKGKNYLLIKGKDGKFYAVEQPGLVPLRDKHYIGDTNE